MNGDHPDVPDLVPARMVNAFAYCPRLAYLEWVQQRFEDNEFTAEGSHIHRTSDEPTGRVPAPGEGEVRDARSVTLSSSEIGVIAKIDILESRSGSVYPIDVKHGRPRADGTVWESDAVQVCLQVLLLREAGYRTNHGVVFYDSIRRRIEIPITTELEERSLWYVSELRQHSAEPVAPPPLIDSPKCPNCSLVAICLPDEINSLNARRSLPPRRLLPADRNGRPLYVTEPGSVLGIDSGRITVRLHGQRVASVRLLDVSQVCVSGNVQVSTQLLRRLFDLEIPTCWFTAGGWFCGIATGLPAKNVDLRIAQSVRAHHGVLLAREFVRGKIVNSRVLLRRNARSDVSAAVDSLKSLAVKAGDATEAASLLGIEGAAARIYFDSFPALLRSDANLPGAPFSFHGRNRRPPRDAVNALLSYVYGLLVKELTVLANTIGLDPYIGLYHRPRFGRPALALDLAEEFRPLLADSVVVTVINNGEVGPSDFIVRAGGVALTSRGRKQVIAAYERRLSVDARHPVFGYTVPYRRVLEVQVRMLGAALLGEIPTYVPFTTR